MYEFAKFKEGPKVKTALFWEQFKITLQLLVKVFPGSGKKNYDLFPIDFPNGISDFIVNTLIFYIEPVDASQVPTFWPADIRIFL